MRKDAQSTSKSESQTRQMRKDAQSNKQDRISNKKDAKCLHKVVQKLKQNSD